MPTPSTQTNDPQAFLEHASYLRRLARGLIGDPGAAEDLVQEAWLASLRAQPRPGVPLRAWLAGWVRHRSMQRGREEGRRAHREAAAARPDYHSPESDTLERLEVLQFVLRTVEALAEPYRTAIRLRFVDDLSAREVADQLGVPLGTVRTRLQRGLAQVRAKLDADCPGGRGALLSALAPLTGLSFPAAGAATGTWFGVTLMQSKVLLAAIAAVVIGCSLFVWRQAQPAAGGLGPAAAGGEAPAQAGGQSLASGAPGPGPGLDAEELSSVREVAPGADPGATLALGGRAYLGAGTEPFPGAAVRIGIYAGTVPASGGSVEPTREPLVVDQLIADGDGQLRWGGARPEGEHWIELTCTMPGHTAVPVRLQVAAGAPAPALNIWLHPLSFRVSGHVRTEGGEAVAGARVHMGHLFTESSADGSYDLLLPALQRDIDLRVDAIGFAREVAFIRPDAGGSMDGLDFSLRQELVVTGRVLDGNGNPIPDVDVEAFHMLGRGVRSGEDGTYRLGALDPGQPKHMLSARKVGYVLQKIDVLSGDGPAQVVDFELLRGVRVEGRVLDDSRSGVAGAELYIGFSPFALDRLDAVVKEGGYFEFDGVGRGPQTLVAQAPGFAPRSIELTVPEDGGVMLGVEVRLSKGHSLAGLVVNSDGEPVSGVTVYALHKGEYVHRDARTDGQGAFHLEALPESEVGLEVVGPGYIRLEHDVAEVGAGDLRLVIQRAGSLAGRVIDGRTGEPVQSFRIRAVDAAREPGDKCIYGLGSSWDVQGHQFDRGDGSWDTGSEQLRIGRVTGVEASAPGYAPAVHGRAVVALDPDPEACVIALFPGTRLHGVVTLASTGLPLEKVRVKRFTAERPLQETEYDDVHGRMQTETSASGSYGFEDLPAGDTHLVLIHPSIGSQVVGPIKIEAGKASVEHNVVISLDGLLRGRLLDGQGKPVAGGTVALRPLLVPGHTSEQDRRILSGPDGSFLFDQLMDGDYEVAHEWLFSNGRGFRHFVRTVTIVGGEAVDVDLAPGGSATIVCRIEAGFELPATVPVWVTRTHGPDGSKLPFAADNNLGVIAKGGSFRLEGLAPGSYQIMPSYYDREKGGLAGGSAGVECTPGSTSEAVVVLSFDD